MENGANRWTDFTYNPTEDDGFYNGSDPLREAKIQLNATDRTTSMPAQYWGVVQPYYHHTNIPTTGVYLYSFALKPEEHQPSGTLNCSRIEGLNIVMTLNTGTAGVTIYPFAVNYNVLRITSGMGGETAIYLQECHVMNMALVRTDSGPACDTFKMLGTPKATTVTKDRKALARKIRCGCYNGKSAAKLLNQPLRADTEKVQRLNGSGRTLVRLRYSLSRMPSKVKCLGTTVGLRFVDYHCSFAWFSDFYYRPISDRLKSNLHSRPS